MSYSKLVGFSALVFAVGLVLSPLFVSAQNTTGLLNVYVQVLNPDQANFSSADFTASVGGSLATPPTFPGSINGTLVTLNPGSYSVGLTGNSYGFSPSYSQGCSGTIGAGQNALCVITLTRYGTYYPTPIAQYYYYRPQLTCAPQNQNVPLNGQATFVAQNGVGGTYNWSVNGHVYANQGPTFTALIDYPGSSSVTVTNADQTATCNVSTTNGYYGTYPTTPAYPLYPSQTYNYYGNGGYTSYPSSYGTYPTNIAPTVTYTSYPTLPNTGFEPTNGAQMAFAVVLLIGAFVASYPYVRKAFALALR